MINELGICCFIHAQRTDEVLETVAPDRFDVSRCIDDVDHRAFETQEDAADIFLILESFKGIRLIATIGDSLERDIRREIEEQD